MDAVILGAGHQHDPLQATARPGDGGDGIHQHVAIGRDDRRIVRGRAGAGLEGGVEDMGDVAQAAELLAHVLEIEQIDRNMAVARRILRGAPRQADDLPFAFGQKLLDDIAADDAQCADDHRFLLQALHVAAATCDIEHSLY